MSKSERFARSKCDRCGKTTKAKQNGIGDLYRIPHEYGQPIADEGDFCDPCCVRYDRENWLEWFKTHRPELFS